MVLMNRNLDNDLTVFKLTQLATSFFHFANGNKELNQILS